MKDRPIAYYTSAHGYGHGVRSCDIINALTRLYPDVRVILTSGLPRTFLKNRLQSDRVRIREGQFDVGMVQLDSIRVDIDATLQAVEDLYSRRDALIEQECRFLKESDAPLVVADIPAIPIEAAKAAGLPALAVGNFDWDWIYSEFEHTDSRWPDLRAHFAEGYAQADLLLRLPFADEMQVFPAKEDFPVVATPGRSRRNKLASLTGARRERKWVLLSFTSLVLSDAALDRLERLQDYEFFTVRPLAWERSNLHAVKREQVCFSDVLASVDAVVSKPGFGLVSECIVNHKPLLYTNRTEFLEYPILVQGIEKHLQQVHLPQEALYEGALEVALDDLWQRPRPSEIMSAGGAEKVARRMMDFYRG